MSRLSLIYSFGKHCVGNFFEPRKVCACDKVVTQAVFFQSVRYLLVDILNGRYKEHYLKYNVLPFEGFDYDSWKYLKQEQKTTETIYDKVDKIVEERIKDFINNEELCM